MNNTHIDQDSSSNKVITFGCRLNIYESEIIKKHLCQSDNNNVIVFNSCAVTKQAEKQVKQAIRKAKKEYPTKKIIVTGCAAQNNPNEFAKMKEVDRVIGNEEKLSTKYYMNNINSDKNSIPGNKIYVNDIMSVKETASHLITEFDNKSRAFIQVQNGCDHRCTFCIIPYARGNSRSVPIGTITKQLKILTEEKNYQEIVLTGVDTTAYGKDLPGSPSLAQMIKRTLALVPEIKRLRLSSIDIAEIDDELFELFAYEKRIMPHIHISLQSGDNMVLKRMKRRHTRDQIINFCNIY